jgi:hypothetical protein
MDCLCLGFKSLYNGHLIIYFQVDGLVNTLGEDDMALAGKLRYEYPVLWIRIPIRMDPHSFGCPGFGSVSRSMEIDQNSQINLVFFSKGFGFIPPS